MKTLFMLLGFAAGVVSSHFIGSDLFPTPADGSYPLGRAVIAFVFGGGGAVVGSFIGGLLGGASADSD